MAWLEEILAEHGEESADFTEEVQTTLAVDEAVAAEGEDVDAPVADEVDEEDADEDADDGNPAREPFSASLNVTDLEPDSRRFVFARPGGRVLAVARPIGPNKSANIKASCSTHGVSCQCWLKPRGSVADADKVLRSLASWASMADNVTVQEHGRKSEEIRMSYGQRVKLKS